MKKTRRVPRRKQRTVAAAARRLGSDLERAFDTQLRAFGPDLPEPHIEYRWDPQRRWRFDRAWPRYRVAVELVGGQYGRTVTCHACGAIVRATTRDGTPGAPIRVGGYHTMVSRYSADCERWNAAAVAGWLVLTFLHDDVYGQPERMVATLREALLQRAWRADCDLDCLVTEREREVMRLVAGGWEASRIAARLRVTDVTLRNYVRRLLHKLNVPNRAAAVARLLACGVLSADEIAWTDAE